MLPMVTFAGAYCQQAVIAFRRIGTRNFVCLLQYICMADRSTCGILVTIADGNVVDKKAATLWGAALGQQKTLMLLLRTRWSPWRWC